ncbi:MAG: hypothetical protein AAF497_03425 [Planctomycetota bacterium]
MEMPWKPLAVMLLCFAGPLLLLDNCQSVPDVVQVEKTSIRLASSPARDCPIPSDSDNITEFVPMPVEITIDELVAEPIETLVTWSVQNIRSTLDRRPSEGSPISGFFGPDRLEMQQGFLLPDLPAGRTDFSPSQSPSISGFSQRVSIQLPRGCQAVIGGDDALLDQLQNAVQSGQIIYDLLLD